MLGFEANPDSGRGAQASELGAAGVDVDHQFAKHNRGSDVRCVVGVGKERGGVVEVASLACERGSDRWWWRCGESERSGGDEAASAHEIDGADSELIGEDAADADAGEAGGLPDDVVEGEHSTS